MTNLVKNKVSFLVLQAPINKYTSHHTPNPTPNFQSLSSLYIFYLVLATPNSTQNRVDLRFLLKKEMLT